MSTSWEDGAKWYSALVGSTGHYYHEHVILPKLQEIFDKSSDISLLDLACGNAVATSLLPKGSTYFGVDASKSLIEDARKRLKNLKGKNLELCFECHDITKPFELTSKSIGSMKNSFSHALIMLALQNLEDPLGALENAKKYLKPNGKLILILNHPCFRIPRQSHWGVDPKKNLQYRRLDSYLSNQAIPIQMNPSKQQSKELKAFHYPLEAIFGFLKKAGFCTEDFQEWISDKKSTGGSAKRENRARKEFPLFCAIVARSDANS